MSNTVTNISRRKFLVGTGQAGAGLMLSLSIPMSAQAKDQATGNDKDFEPNAFIRIDQNSQVIVSIKHLEMGQGTYTGLATLVAEELDADWSQVSCVGAAADTEKYANIAWGKFQGTGGSTGLANSFMQLREAGAATKAMLIAAAAKLWQVPASDISIKQGQVTDSASGRTVSFGQLAALAALEKLPENVTLKSPSQFQLIGKNIPRKDHGKTNGTAIFTQDINLPGQLTAMVAHPPKFDAKVKSFDATSAKQVAGVEAVVEIPTGIAVLAKDYWQAKKARDLLVIEWDESQAFQKSTEQQLKEYAALAEKPGNVASTQGNINQALKDADKVIELNYQFPYLSHAPMEPMNCVVQLNYSGSQVTSAHLKFGCQIHTGDQMAVAGALGIEPKNVEIETLFAGGSFGRRANSQSDYVLEAVSIAKAFGKATPVKLVWSREDDTQAGYYRPMYFHKLKAGLDKQGNLIAWQHRIVGQSIVAGTAFSGLIHNGIDHTSVEGASNLPYDIPNKQVELHTTEENVPVLWWRAVGSTHTAYATECFLDEIAKQAGKTPVELRRALLKDHPRHLGVLEKAVAASGMTDSTGNTGKHFGVAVHKSFGTYVAQVVELSKKGSGYHMEKVTCAVDCGIAVNPDVIKAQMEGGIGFGLSPALYSSITFDQGKVQQSNFHDYQVIRMKDMPDIDVHIIASAEPPTGVGEPGTPVIAPALANALRAAGEGPYEQLPLSVQLT